MRKVAQSGHVLQAQQYYRNKTDSANIGTVEYSVFEIDAPLKIISNLSRISYSRGTYFNL